MDNTNKYVEMCVGAKEIHTLVQSNYDGTYGSKEDFWGYSMQKDKLVWLPRQDQLQKMLSKTCTLGYFISGLHEFFDPESLCPDADGEYPPCSKCLSAGKERRTTYETMEQWWLAFVMSELYTKKWNGTEWVYDSSWKVPYHAEDAQEQVTNRGVKG